MKTCSRRRFISTGCGAAAAAIAGRIPAQATAHEPLPPLGLGVTTGSFMNHLSPQAAEGRLRLLDLPKIMRDELDMRIIDLMTATLASTEPAYLEQLRKAAADAGCILTNLKMNNKGIDMAAADEASRRHAIDEYKRAIDAAALLGVRWVRPLPGNKEPDLQLIAAGYHELMDYAAPKGISLLVENFGWMQSDPDALPNVIHAAGRDLKAQPDTGNWTNEARYEGLKKAYPFAVSSDFKAFEMGPDGSHARYDLKRCFDIGWEAGFRGPWCFEHFHTELKPLLQEMGVLRDMLRGWTRERTA